MQVPYSSSGALSRVHYSLVQKVELADSIQSADHALFAEFESIRDQFRNRKLNIDRSRQCLIILLYCFANASPGVLPREVFDFALPHALTLAEAGHELRYKRTGYLFCSELMPTDSDLRLMLVNTLRKDLDCDSTPRICLALDTIITSAYDDLVPAVEPRLHDLLSHSSPHVRRRSLLAFRSLCTLKPELLGTIVSSITPRLRDSSSSVAIAAVLFSAHAQMKLSNGSEIRRGLVELFRTVTRTTREQVFVRNPLLLCTLSVLRPRWLSREELSTVFDLIRLSSRSGDVSVVRECFALLSSADTECLKGLVKSRSPIQDIRDLIASRDVNDHYLFLLCLSDLDPSLWAGVTSDVPGALEGWEVERVMQMVDSRDSLLRRLTLKILNKVDSNIISSYYADVLQSMLPGLSTRAASEYAERLLEMAEVQCGHDGEAYARELKALLERVEEACPEKPLVLETAVEMIMRYISSRDLDFRLACATTLISFALDSDVAVCSTLLVVIVAVAAEYCGKLSISPQVTLVALGHRLPFYIRSVQDACLVAMLRLVADCESVPTSVIDTVRKVKERAGRYIQRRCEQFISLSGQQRVLKDIAREARSSSLPDFLESLSKERPPSAEHFDLSGSQGLAKSQLRYAPYEPPAPTASLRALKDKDARSQGANDIQDGRSSSTRSERLTKTFDQVPSAGTLTLVAGMDEVKLDEGEASALTETDSSQQLELEPRADLIAFDTPFVNESYDIIHERTKEVDFESLWNSMEEANGSRGWCDIPVGELISGVQQSEGVDIRMTEANAEPFKGDVKVVLRWQDGGLVALRLREMDEDGCLWRMRSELNEGGEKVKKLLSH